jgi:hypothetical protein
MANYTKMTRQIVNITATQLSCWDGEEARADFIIETE